MLQVQLELVVQPARLNTRQCENYESKGDKLSSGTGLCQMFTLISYRAPLMIFSVRENPTPIQCP